MELQPSLSKMCKSADCQLLNLIRNLKKGENFPSCYCYQLFFLNGITTHDDLCKDLLTLLFIVTRNGITTHKLMPEKSRVLSYINLKWNHNCIISLNGCGIISYIVLKWNYNGLLTVIIIGKIISYINPRWNYNGWYSFAFILKFTKYMDFCQIL